MAIIERNKERALYLVRAEGYTPRSFHDYERAIAWCIKRGLQWHMA